MNTRCGICKNMCVRIYTTSIHTHVCTNIYHKHTHTHTNWSMALAVSSKCSEHILLAQECVKASLAMLTNTSHLSWGADLVILEENICETTVLKFLLERDQKYDCCNRPRSTLACFLFS